LNKLYKDLNIDSEGKEANININMNLNNNNNNKVNKEKIDILKIDKIHDGEKNGLEEFIKCYSKLK
jgi:hypothetical protein